MQHAVTHCNTLQHAAPHYTTLHHTAPPYTTLHQTAPRCTTLHHAAPRCTTLHHTALHCTTLHHTAPHYNKKWRLENKNFVHSVSTTRRTHIHDIFTWLVRMSHVSSHIRSVTWLKKQILRHEVWSVGAFGVNDMTHSCMTYSHASFVWVMSPITSGPWHDSLESSDCKNLHHTLQMHSKMVFL